MTISGMVKSSLVDYPGLAACVLFTPACNYDCFYCHNRALIEGGFPPLDKREVIGFLKKRAGLLGGVVVSGGEPTIQPGLFEFLREVKALGYKIKLDTNGSNPDAVARALDEQLCDYFAVDYKAPAARYAEIAGAEADVKTVLETVNLLLRRGADFEVRTTVIPQLSEFDLVRMAAELPPLPRYVLNRYRKPDIFPESVRDKIEKRPYTRDKIAAFAETLRPLQPHVTV